MRVAHFTRVLTLILIAAPAVAQMRPIERVVEASATTIVLPATTGGSVTVHACTRCPVQTMPTNTATRYLIGENPVALADFADFLRNNPRRSVVVMYDEQTKIVTQVRAYPPATR
jgi:hypothetical protein